jgi:hypothetical protein
MDPKSVPVPIPNLVPHPVAVPQAPQLPSGQHVPSLAPLPTVGPASIPLPSPGPVATGGGGSGGFILPIPPSLDPRLVQNLAIAGASAAGILILFALVFAI